MSNTFSYRHTNIQCIRCEQSGLLVFCSPPRDRREMNKGHFVTGNLVEFKL
jgi:hypothetical protein